MRRVSDPIDAILRRAPVIPVLTVDDARTAVSLGRALVAGGLPVLEVTLRTDAALDAVRIMAAEIEGAIVGAGTVLTGAQLDRSAGAGARFAVSPGASPGLLAAAEGHTLPLLPGSATASETMALLERGYRHQKFFPAEPVGGRPYLAALASPLPEVRFCPTGGITPGSAPGYLALPNVACVGGSWIAPKELVEAGEWQAIESLAREAADLRRRPSAEVTS